ncbi:MAG: hypothetical protein O3A47_12465, partial [Chloroflexi bacterium]|nr:hypothetical protein [Chloroflexota bacterium]
QGAGWVQISAYRQRADEAFNPVGDRQSFIGGSTFNTRSAYLTGAFGVAEGLEIWAQVPVHRLSVNGAAGRSEGNGVGDVRAALRVSPALFGLEIPVALRFGAKLPGNDFPVDARLLPLTEGQRDFEVSLETGWSPIDLPVYVVGWVGHRWRGENEIARFQPGNERFAHGAVGAWAGPVSVELGLDALWGSAPDEQGLRLESGRRRFVQLLPTVGADVGPGRLELTTPIPVSGRNLPAGIGLSVGYRVVWGR